MYVYIYIFAGPLAQSVLDHSSSSCYQLPRSKDRTSGSKCKEHDVLSGSVLKLIGLSLYIYIYIHIYYIYGHFRKPLTRG